MKKIISILLIAIMVAAQLSVNVLASDIDGHWSKDAFLVLEDKGIITGYADGSYGPDNNITRAELFTIINRISKVNKNSGSVFSDVKSGEWYKNDIDYAYTAKYASGYNDGSFRPNDFITRAETAAAICKAFGGDIEAVSDFSDSIDDWVRLYVDMLVSSGLISGYEDGTFRGDEFITRGETAAIFNKLVGDVTTATGEETEKTYSENLIIAKADIKFNDCIFDGDIYIGPGVTDGEVRFINCVINGNVYVSGRETAQVVFENTDCNKVSVFSPDMVELVCTGTSRISNAVIRSEAVVQELNAEAGIEKVMLYAAAQLSGDFDIIEVADGSGCTLNGSIGTLLVTASANPKITLTGEIDKIEADASFVLNDKAISAGSSKNNVSTNNSSSNVSYSYSLAALQNGTYEGIPTAGGTREEVLSKDYLLDNLIASAGTLVPSFDPNVTSYILDVPNNADLTLTPVCNELIECQVKGKVIENEYTVADFADTTNKIIIDLYGGLVKRTSYEINVRGYGTDNLDLNAVTCNVPNTVTEGSDSYTFDMTGTIDYSQGTIPATISFETLNPNTVVKINGAATKAYTVDLYNERVISFDAVIISQDGTATKTCTVTVKREKIVAIDDPDLTVLQRVLANPSSWQTEDSSRMKLSSVNSEKFEKYKAYLAKIKYLADGKTDLYELQAVVQDAVDTVNEFDGKTVRMEAEEFDTSGGGRIKSADYAETNGVMTAGCISVWAPKIDFGFDAPEGTFELKVVWCQRWWNNADIKVNSNSAIVVSPKNIQKDITTIASDEFGVTTHTIALIHGSNAIKFRRSGADTGLNNTALDYIEITFNF